MVTRSRKSIDLNAGNFAVDAACPACRQLLPTPLARQCFQCGFDWHSLTSTASRGETPWTCGTAEFLQLGRSPREATPRDSRRPGLASLGFAMLIAQCAAVVLILLFVIDPLAFALSIVIGVPAYFWLDRRFARSVESSRCPAWAGKAIAIGCGAMSLAFPGWLMPAAIFLLAVAAAVALLLSRRNPPVLDPVVPSSVARLLLAIAGLLAACQILGFGSMVVACFLATVAVLEFGALMLALDSWQSVARS